MILEHQHALESGGGLCMKPTSEKYTQPIYPGFRWQVDTA